MEKAKRRTEARGITLIALVITVIVLLILAAISITMLTGDNSILKRAVDAKERTERAQEEENAKLTFTTVQMELAQGKNVDNQSFQKMVDENFGSNNANGIIDGNNYIITVVKTNNNYQMDSNGKISTLAELPIDFNPGVLEKSGETYTINSIEDLVAFAYSINKGEQEYNNKNITLGIDLDIKSDSSYKNPNTKYKLTDNGYEKTEDDTGTPIKTLLTDTNGIGFVPIGKTYNESFSGIFDGLSHTISNLYIKTSGDKSAGLFNNIANTFELKNLGLNSPNITSGRVARWICWNGR